MKKEIVTLEEKQFVGIATRTSNANEFDPQKAKIGNMISEYFSKNIGSSIKNRKTPGITYCLYTEYESDHTGEYTYFIGEEVSESSQNLEENMRSLTVPASHYVKFTNEEGPMPKVCIDMWLSIWDLTASDLGGTRTFVADFEVYDERSQDPQKAVLDIYIGINPNQ